MGAAERIREEGAKPVALLTRQALDVNAFAELFARTHESLYAYAAAFTLDRAAAEDVVQRAFELAYARRESFRPELGSADAWMFGIARHVALDERRRMTRRPAPAPGTDAAHDRGADGGLEGTDRRDALFAAVRTLHEQDREVIALKFWADLPNVEIAALLGCSESSVGTRLHRAIARLREVCNDVR
jgi:RNA polymerase sigma-70 factor, ECF subfamily